MKGLDTNVLLRYLLHDDPAQAARAAALLEDASDRDERLTVSVVVLCEIVWVLTRSLRRGREEIVDVLEHLLESSLFEVQSREPVRRALADYLAGRGDFPDYLVGRLDESAGATSTWTFDRDLTGHPRFEVLPPEGDAT